MSTPAVLSISPRQMFYIWAEETSQCPALPTLIHFFECSDSRRSKADQADQGVLSADYEENRSWSCELLLALDHYLHVLAAK